MKMKKLASAGFLFGLFKDPEFHSNQPRNPHNMMKMNMTKLALAGFITTGLFVQAQDDDEEVFELSPFAVDASDDVGYRATTTLAGSRVRSKIGDIGASISILTEEFMQDTGATDGESLLQFVGNVEVGGVLGNFSNSGGSNNTQESRVNPQRGQRVRGLDSAILTRDYFQTDIPFDAYNTSRVSVNRGPNSILFGLGGPSGVINNSTKLAYIGSDNTDFSFRMDHRGGTRATFDIGRTLIEDRLAIRVSGMAEELKFKQKPAFEDDTRLYLAWDATIFRNEDSNWLGRTSARGSYETGKIERNPPDVAPPTDRYSSWFHGIGTQDDLNRILSVPGTDFDDINNGAVTQAQVRSAIAGGYAELPDGVSLDDFAATEGQFVPRTTVDRFKRGDPLGNDTTEGGRNSSTNGTPYFLFPAVNFNSVDSQTPGWETSELNGIQGIMGRWRPRGFSTQDVRWTTAGVGQGGTGFQNPSLSNRDVFDYHNLLFMGTSNFVNTDFELNQVFLNQELFGGRVGIELAFDKQVKDLEEFTPFDSGDGKAIQLDVSQNHSPGDSNFDGIADRLFNENVGRPVIRWNDNNVTNSKNTKDTIRATVFGTLDFSEVMNNDRWGKILGKHTVTGLYEEKNNENYSLSTRGSWWADEGKWPGSPDISNGLSDNFRRIVKSQVYVGPDVRGLTSADQLKIDGYIDVPFPQIGDEYGIWYFDNGEKTDKINTWRIIENISNGGLSRQELTSEAFSLQSSFLDGHVVALYAERSDEELAFERIQSTIGYGLPGIDVENGSGTRINLDGTQEIDGSFNVDLLQLQADPSSINGGDTSTKSLVVKFPEAYLFELPFGMDLQAHYYEADSFQPAGVSKNILGEPLASPLGDTTEKGITMTLLEGKLSIKYNEFETSNANNRTNLGGALGNIAGYWSFMLDRITSADNDTATSLFPSESDALLTPDTSPKTNRDRLTGTDADLAGFTSFDDYYAQIIGALLPELQSNYNYRIEEIDGENVDQRDPFTGLNSTRDFVATGKEIDVVGQLTKNVTVQFNVAQQKTVTSNTGPIAIPLAFRQAAELQKALPNSAGGYSIWDLRDSPFQVETGTNGRRYQGFLNTLTVEKAKDGTQLAEQREWRSNLTLRYDFIEGAFKGFQVGGSLRYQDRVGGGYPNLLDDLGNVIPDIANPYLGPDSIDGDMFFRYKRKIMNGRTDWTIQLNARNFYRSNGDDDIPVDFNVDGTVSITRIPVERQWFLTNSFSF